MNYEKIYKNIILKRKVLVPNEYYEKHHILPRSMGGKDNKENIVCLTAKEHFLCHLLLIKIYRHTKYFYKAVNMFNMMFSQSKNQLRYINGKWYEKYRSDFAKKMSFQQQGSKNSNFGNTWVSCLETKKSIIIPRNELDKYLSLGYVHKRVVDFDRYIKEENLKKQREYERKKKTKNNIEYYTSLYNIYNKFGWNFLLKETGYSKSKQNLVKNFKKYVKDFIPQNGKKRGII